VLKTYEALLIYPNKLKEEDLDNAIVRVRDDISKLGGAPGAVEKLGSQTFARPLGKQQVGFYVRLAFSLDPERVAALRKRLRLNEELFREQITRVEQPVVEPADASAEQE
jgi:ribosomal protein S6